MSDDAVTALSFSPCWHSVATLICYDVIVTFVGNDQFLHNSVWRVQKNRNAHKHGLLHIIQLVQDEQLL